MSRGSEANGANGKEDAEENLFQKIKNQNYKKVKNWKKRR